MTNEDEKRGRGIVLTTFSAEKLQGRAHLPPALVRSKTNVLARARNRARQQDSQTCLITLCEGPRRLCGAIYACQSEGVFLPQCGLCCVWSERVVDFPSDEGYRVWGEQTAALDDCGKQGKRLQHLSAAST